MKKVLVTGATGMVGATLIDQLLKNDIQVTGLVRPSSLKMDNLSANPNLTVIECDIDNLLSLKNVLEKDYDTFFHFAWNGTYGESRQDIRLQIQNIKDTMDAVELANITGCKTFVGAGSQAEFGYVQGNFR